MTLFSYCLCFNNNILFLWPRPSCIISHWIWTSPIQYCISVNTKLSLMGRQKKVGLGMLLQRISVKMIYDTAKTLLILAFIIRHSVQFSYINIPFISRLWPMYFLGERRGGGAIHSQVIKVLSQWIGTIFQDYLKPMLPMSQPNTNTTTVGSAKLISLTTNPRPNPTNSTNPTPLKLLGHFQTT